MSPDDEVDARHRRCDRQTREERQADRQPAEREPEHGKHGQRVHRDPKEAALQTVDLEEPFQDGVPGIEKWSRQHQVFAAQDPRALVAEEMPRVRGARVEEEPLLEECEMVGPRQIDPGAAEDEEAPRGERDRARDRRNARTDVAVHGAG